MRTVSQVLEKLPSPNLNQLPAPVYSRTNFSGTKHLALTVPSMARHMSDEGWQIMLGLGEAGYILRGGVGQTNVPDLIAEFNPSTIVFQDKREWDTTSANWLAKAEENFKNIQCLADRCDTFKLTILKDSHQRPLYHMESAVETACNGWIVYYHPRIVKHLAPYTRPEHYVRTYHSINPLIVPPFQPHRENQALLSGAIQPGVYPVRLEICRRIPELLNTRYLRHPGYHNHHCHTPEMLMMLAQFKVAICTSSIFGYALRKIIEATAAGCIVVTDLPTDEVMPHIDGNLVRFQSDHPAAIVEELKDLLPKLYSSYNPEQQQHYANAALNWYSYQQVGLRLAQDIEVLRSSYND